MRNSHLRFLKIGEVLSEIKEEWCSIRILEIKEKSFVAEILTLNRSYLGCVVGQEIIFYLHHTNYGAEENSYREFWSAPITSNRDEYFGFGIWIDEQGDKLKNKYLVDYA